MSGREGLAPAGDSGGDRPAALRALEAPDRASADRGAWVWPTLAAAVLRLAVAPFAEDQWGDAPVRLELVRRFFAAPRLFWGYDDVFQYGPLPTNLAGLLAIAGLGPELAARSLVVACGIAGVGLAASLAQRFGGPRAGLAAGFALALSPIHLQASTTFASEAIYVALALACVHRAIARDPWGSAAFAFAASTTRYDAWLWLPLLGAWWLWRGLPERRGRALLAAALLAAGPLSIFVANALESGDPMRPLSHISAEHVVLARDAQERVGTLEWRFGMLGYWPLAMLALLTPGFAVALFAGVVRAWKARSEALAPIGFGAVAPALYAFRSVVLGTFWPMARFGLGPVALASAAMPALRPRTLAACVVLALAFDASLVALDDGEPGTMDIATALSPVSRLPDDVHAGARALLEGPQPAMLDTSPWYTDILVAHAAKVDRFEYQRPWDRKPPPRIVALRGGALEARLRGGGVAYGRKYRLAGEKNRVSWWDRID